MANRALLIDLAKLVAKDVGTKRVGDQSLYAADVVRDVPDALPQLLDLLFAEDAKKRPSKRMISAYMYLFDQSLDSLRFRIEAGYAEAKVLFEAVCARIADAGRGSGIDTTLLFLLMNSLNDAGLDPGDDLRGLFNARLEQDSRGSRPTGGEASPNGYFEQVVKASGGDVFLLFANLLETGASLPEDHRLAMAALMAQSDQPEIREAVIGWLLDPAPGVRNRVARGLGEISSTGGVSPTMLRRMITLRNWLPEADRPALDSAIQVIRRSGVDCASWPEAKLGELLISGVDGSGAVGVLATVAEGRKYGFASILLKHGVGVRDAWASHACSRAEVKATVDHAAEAGLMAIDAEALRVAIGHFLAVGLANGAVPPFGLVDALETAGFPALHPTLVPTGRLLEMLDDRLASEAGGKTGAASIDHCSFLDSWFELGDEVNALLTGKRLSRAKREALVMEKVIEPRRTRWADLLAWTAYLMAHAGRSETAASFYREARAALDGTPLAKLPTMNHVARMTVEAFLYNNG